MIDAAGAIYVLGGRYGSGNYLADVWASTDGGVHRTRAEGGRAVLGGHSRGYLGGFIIIEMYYRGTRGALRCTIGA